MRKRFSAAVILAAIVLAGAACTSSTSTSSGSGKSGGTLKIGTFGDVQSFDPALAQASSGVFINTVYDTLLRQDKDENLRPALATKWTQPDPSTWQFTLRTGVTFTDGTPFDSAAVKANLEHDKSTPGPNQAVFADITSIDTPSPDAVVVRFSTPNPSFDVDMSTSLGAMGSPMGITAGTLAKDPVGTGGWVYDPAKSQVGVKYVFAANPNYWDKPNQKVKTVEISVIADNNARINALKTGAVDVIDAVFPTAADDLRGAGLQVVSQPDQVVMMFIGDRDGKVVPALKDPRVREAMNLAIDRQAVQKTLGAGTGDDSATVYAQGSKWYDSANADLLKYNPDKAKQLLKEAGYANGFTFEAPVFSTTQTQNEAIAQQLAAVGITMNLVPVAPGTAGPEFRKQKYPVVFGPVSVVHPNDFWSVFVRADGGWDPFKVDTSKIDDLAENAARAKTPDEQKKIYGQMEAEILREGVFLLLGHTPILAAASKNVSGALYIEDGERSIRPLGLSVSG